VDFGGLNAPSAIVDPDEYLEPGRSSPLHYHRFKAGDLISPMNEEFR
jgi:hypothetical protein